MGQYTDEMKWKISGMNRVVCGDIERALGGETLVNAKINKTKKLFKSERAAWIGEVV